MISDSVIITEYKKLSRIIQRFLDVSVLFLVQHLMLVNLPIYLPMCLSKDRSIYLPFYFLTIFLTAKIFDPKVILFYSKYIPIDMLYWRFYAILHGRSVKLWKTYSITWITIEHVAIFVKWKWIFIKGVGDPTLQIVIRCFLQKRRFEKFRQIDREIPLLKSTFDKKDCQ